MTPAPRQSIDANLVEGRKCFICAEPSLGVTQHAGFPDVVTCAACSSVFVLDETGEWVMYGSIASDFAEARGMALRQWASPQAVVAAAAADRARLRMVVAESPIEPEPPTEPEPEPPAVDEQPPSSAAVPSFQEVEDFVEDQVPAAVDEVGSGGFLLEEEAEEEDFTSRLAALAGVPIDDEIFQAIDEDQRELAFEQSLAEPSPSAADEGAIGDDWLQAPGEGELWGSPQPEAAEDDANASLRSLLRSEPEPFDVFSLSPLPEVAEEDRAAPAEGEGPSIEAGMLASRLAAQAVPAAAPAPAEATGSPPSKQQLKESKAPPPEDPPPGTRYRAVIRGNRVRFPSTGCAHCMTTPARRKLPVRGTLPAGQALGQRKPTTFNIPVCARCHKRAHTRTPEEKAMRLQANLISAVVALIVLVATLLLDVITLDAGALVSGLVLLIILILGYAVPMLILSGRASRFATPEDALYVRSTLLVPEETQGLETAFEWRNRGFAEAFLEANQDQSLGQVIQVKDRAVINA